MTEEPKKLPRDPLLRMVTLIKHHPLVRWVMVVYTVGFIVLVFPQVYHGVPRVFRGLIEDYRQIFVGERGHKPDAPSTAQPSGSSLPDRLSSLEERIASISENRTQAQIDEIATELQELREAILGDPEKALTIQRLSFEVKALHDQVDGLSSQSRWLFGITLTLALGVLGAVFGLLKASSPKRKDKRDAAEA